MPNLKFNEKTTYLYKKISSSDLSIEPYSIRHMDYMSDNDIGCWCNIVNLAYDDSNYSFSHAREFLLNHSFCVDNETVFLIFEEKEIATISYGRISGNESVGTFFRIAVLPSFQNRGIGKLLIKIAEFEMSKQGIQKIEESISLKREASFSMHFKSGYKPEIFTIQRAIKRPFIKELILTVSFYNAIINIITWKKYKKYKK